MSKWRRISWFVLILLAAHIFVPVAQAHPLGNFSVNQYAGLQVTDQSITIDYVLDMAEIPAFQEMPLIDTNGNGGADPDEIESYRPAKCEDLRSDLHLRLNGKPAFLYLVSSSLEFPPGQSGMATMRLNCTFRSDLPAVQQGGLQVDFDNAAFTGRLGWREVVVLAPGLSLQGNFATTSPSDRLTSYPEEMLARAPDQRRASFRLQAQGASGAAPAQVEQIGTSSLARQDDPFTRLILLDEWNFSTLLLVFGVSLLWGALHALTPGHGKTIVGAYLVGSRGTARHAVYLGLTTTITHTAGVFALGLVTLFASQFILPETLFPWLNLASGLLVVVIGLNMFLSRFRQARGFPLSALLGQPAKKWSGFQAVDPPHAIILNSTPHHNSHGHPHPHAHDPGSHQHPMQHAHEHEHEHDHEHEHTHLPPGWDGAPVTWRSLLALGVSGGLLPCPSALVVLLSAIAFGRVAFGILLVVVFSLGLAGVLTGMGILFVYAGRLLEVHSGRLPLHRRLLDFLPALSALFITLLGFGITLRALSEMGVFF